MRKMLLAGLCAGLVQFAFGQTDSATWFHQKGIEEKEARRFREAEKKFSRAAALDPKNASYTIELATAILEQKRYVEAREKYLAAEQLSPNDTVVIQNLATLSLNTRKWADAIRYAQKMQQLKIGSGANFMIAKSQYELEDYGQALKYCELAFRDDPKKAETPYIAARCFVEMSNYKKAAGCYEQALERDSSNATWMYEAGLTYFAIPDDKKAIYWFERAGASGYKKTNDYLENLANAWLNTGNFEKGSVILQELLAKKPGDTELLYNIGDAYYKANRFQEAIDYWDRILAADKKNANALYMIGLAYQRKGEKEKGMQLCDQAIQMDPSLKNLRTEKKMPGGM